MSTLTEIDRVIKGFYCNNMFVQENLLAAVQDWQHMLYESFMRDVPRFTGKQSEYKTWTQHIEKVFQLMGNKDLYALRAAVTTTQGYVMTFIQRYITDHEAHNDGKWKDLKQNIETHIDLALDPTNALLQLRNLKQEKGQTYQMYAEDLLTLAPPGVDEEGGYLQRELVSIFTMGVVLNGKIGAHLVRHPSDKLKDAIKTANEKAQVLERVNLYNKPFPSQQEYKIHRPTQPTKNEEPIHCSVHRFQYTSSGQPICNKCGKAGYVYRDCQVRTLGTVT